jgi:hypothetical protein
VNPQPQVEFKEWILTVDVQDMGHARPAFVGDLAVMEVIASRTLFLQSTPADRQIHWLAGMSGRPADIRNLRDCLSRHQPCEEWLDQASAAVADFSRLDPIERLRVMAEIERKRN